MTKEFRKLGFDVLPSAANFLFVEPVGISAADLFGKLRERGILVRYFPKPRIDRRLRITVGTQEEMDALRELRCVRDSERVLTASGAENGGV